MDEPLIISLVGGNEISTDFIYPTNHEGLNTNELLIMLTDDVTNIIWKSQLMSTLLSINGFKSINYDKINNKIVFYANHNIKLELLTLIMPLLINDSLSVEKTKISIPFVSLLSIFEFIDLDIRPQLNERYYTSSYSNCNDHWSTKDKDKVTEWIWQMINCFELIINSN